MGDELVWIIGRGVSAELHFFTGLSFSGARTSVKVFHDCRKQGDPVDAERVKSFGIITQHGTRVVLTTTAAETWEAMPWRAVVVQAGTTFTSKAGHPAVQIPDLDSVDAFDANRTNTEVFVGYPHAESLALGTGWTFGRTNPAFPIKGHLRTIRLDRI